MDQCLLGKTYANKSGNSVICMPCTQCGEGNFKAPCTRTSDAECIKPVAPPNSPHWTTIIIILLVLVALGFLFFTNII